MRNGRHLGRRGSLARIAKKLRTTPITFEKLRQITLKVTDSLSLGSDRNFLQARFSVLIRPVVSLPRDGAHTGPIE
jgi:hypothetical protein